MLMERLNRTTARLAQWKLELRARRTLRELDPHILKDIGLEGYASRKTQIYVRR